MPLSFDYPLPWLTNLQPDHSHTRSSVLMCRAEGAIVTSKELILSPHRQVPVPNLHVVKLMASLKSKGVVRERFSWQYLYYVLTDEGIEYLRNYLHLPEDTVPSTLKKPSKPQPPSTIGRRYDDDGEGRGRGRGRGRGEGRGGMGRGGYRKDDMGAPRGFNPEFAGGEGGERGRGRGRGGYGGGRGGFDGEGRGGYGGGRGDFGGGRGDFGGRGGRGRGRGESSTEA